MFHRETSTHGLLQTLCCKSGCIVVYSQHSQSPTMNPNLPMRRRHDQATVGFSARIDTDDRQRFEAALPMSGGKTWAVQEALEYFCAMCEGSVALQTYVHDQVLEMRATEPPRRQEELGPQIPKALYDRFNRLFPEKGATTWFLRKFAAEFNKQVVKHPGLHEDIRQSVRAVLNVAP